jgi:hypothetical protein
MFWFDVIFVPIMLLIPLGISLLVQIPRDVEIDLDRYRMLSRWLWMGTLASLVAFAITYTIFPPNIGRLTWLLAFPLLMISIPLMNIKNPYFVIHSPAITTRSASLVNRRETLRVPRIYNILLLGLTLVAGIIISLRLQDFMNQQEWIRWGASLGIVSLNLFLIGVCNYSISRISSEPEPMDSQNSEELREAYARFRRQKMIGLLTLGGIQNIVMIAFALIMTYGNMTAELNSMIGWTGGIFGTLIGIGGAVFGTMASFQRARINRLYQQLQNQNSQSPTTS